MTQSDEDVKTDLLHITSTITPRLSLDEVQGTSSTRTNILVSEKLPLMDLMANQRDKILTGIQIKEFERKERMSTKVIDETTLRIYFPKASNADLFTRSESTMVSSTLETSNTVTSVKDKYKAISTQDYACL